MHNGKKDLPSLLHEINNNNYNDSESFRLFTTGLVFILFRFLSTVLLITLFLFIELSFLTFKLLLHFFVYFLYFLPYCSLPQNLKEHLKKTTQDHDETFKLKIITEMYYVICWGQDKVTMVIVVSYIFQFNSLYATDLKRGFRKVDKGLKERHRLNFLSTTEQPLISENFLSYCEHSETHFKMDLCHYLQQIRYSCMLYSKTNFQISITC